MSPALLSAVERAKRREAVAALETAAELLRCGSTAKAHHYLGIAMLAAGQVEWCERKMREMEGRC